MLIASLREVIHNQSQEIESMQAKVKELSASGNEVSPQLPSPLSHMSTIHNSHSTPDCAASKRIRIPGRRAEVPIADFRGEDERGGEGTGGLARFARRSHYEAETR